jgi:hypothetical protein
MNGTFMFNDDNALYYIKFIRVGKVPARVASHTLMQRNYNTKGSLPTLISSIHYRSFSDHVIMNDNRRCKLGVLRDGDTLLFRGGRY